MFGMPSIILDRLKIDMSWSRQVSFKLNTNPFKRKSQSQTIIWTCKNPNTKHCLHLAVEFACDNKHVMWFPTTMITTCRLSKEEKSKYKQPDGAIWISKAHISAVWSTKEPLFWNVNQLSFPKYRSFSPELQLNKTHYFGNIILATS